MYDTDFLQAMLDDATARDWDDAAELLEVFLSEAHAEACGAFLFLHLGEVERAIANAGLKQPPLAALVDLLHASGHAASLSHIQSKALKTTASLAEIVSAVAANVEA